ncbi:PAS domain S-box protein [Methanoculleus frigidifontis]|uniref:PAS domain S-box protein n=1 Tax=Methanoculleus frigidifontis TaxID=2584085 RepID=UPI0026587FA0|nr:PAS domain S-box protein [Methanoculleus sp. FWC-SCC1]
MLQAIADPEDALLIATHDLAVIWMSQTMERLLGLTLHDARGADLGFVLESRLIPLLPGEEPCGSALLTALRRSEEVPHLTCPVRTVTGVRWYDYSSARLQEEPGSEPFWIVRLHDVTCKVRTENELQRCRRTASLLADAATELVGLSPDTDIYAVIARHLCALVPGATVIVSTADIRRGTLTTRAVAGDAALLAGAAEILGADMRGMTLTLPPAIRSIMLKGGIETVLGGIAEAALGQLPKEVCRRLEEYGRIGAVYCIPFTWKGEVFGSAVIFTRQGGEALDTDTVDTFRGLAAIALQRRCAETGLRENEEKFRLLAEHAQDIIYRFVYTPVLHVAYVSPSVAAITGHVPEEFYADPSLYLSIIHPDDRPKIDSLLRGDLRESATLTLRERSRDGTVIWMEHHVTPIFDDTGNLVAVEGISRNITARKRVEEQLRIRDAAIESSPTPFLIATSEGTISSANAAALEQLGYDDAAALIGRNVREFTSSSDAAEAITRALLETGSYRGEIPGRRRNGRTTTILLSARAIAGAAEQPGRIAVSFIDIGDRKRAEDELKRRARYLSVLNEVIGISVASLSLDDLLESVLLKVLPLLDVDRGAIYILDPARKKAHLRWQHGIPEAQRAQNRVLDIRHWPENLVFVAGQPWYIGRTRGIGAAAGRLLNRFDVSALACIPLLADSVVVGALYLGTRKRAAFSSDEKTILEAVGRAVGSGLLKMLLLQQLEDAHQEANLYLDILTHDIGNTENVSTLYADLLLETLEGEKALYAAKLRASIQKSIEILRSVSTIRKIHEESPALKPVDLDAVLRGEIDHVPSVPITYDGFPVTVWADELLAEVPGNLIGNAVRFGGSDVAITVRVEELDGEVLVSIEDTGPGIPDAQKEAIFHRFERGRGRATGQGLGLYIVRMLVTRYGGEVRVEDRACGRPEEGAAFRFTLRKAGAGEGI